MDLAEATDHVHQVAQAGFVFVTRHCTQRMEERGVGHQDLESALTTGQAAKVEPNEDGDGWRVEFHGEDAGGDPLTIHLALAEDLRSLACITVY